MTLYNKDGKEIFELDDIVLIILASIIAFMVVGHC